MSTRTSKAELADRCETLSAENVALHRALNAVLDGETSPAFRKGDYTLRLVDVNGASGGIVIVTYAPKCNRKPYSSAHFWEKWYHDTSTNLLAGFRDSEAFTVREVAFKAHQWVLEQQRVSTAA